MTPEETAGVLIYFALMIARIAWDISLLRRKALERRAVWCYSSAAAFLANASRFPRKRILD
jgi:hypothetical protein